MLEEWIQCYLQLTQKAIPILEDFLKEDHLYMGVVKFPLRLIQCDGIRLGESHTDEDDHVVASSAEKLKTLTRLTTISPL